MADRHHQGMGRRIRPRPKSVLLAALWNDHRAALTHDWLKAYHAVFRPLRWDEWAKGATARIHWGWAWQLTREILKDHSSHSWHALCGDVYDPTDVETIAWALLGKRHERPPWQDTRHDPLHAVAGPHRLTRRQREDRERLKAYFHIQDDL